MYYLVLLLCVSFLVTAEITPCIENCMATAANSAGCSGFSDGACVCTSVTFQTQESQCLQANCSPKEAQDGILLMNRMCKRAKRT
ncbi:hypothetical protein K501DRAFT_176437 [Backusella circina FSU 941]|nr:hypothetical protein K501DRAFT_176437 [Backusella circina FSU 941]